MPTLTWQGEIFEPLAEKALHWPRERAVVLADAHLGKAEQFRAAGVPVPRGTTASNLARLTALIERTAAERLLILGDLFHGPASLCDSLIEQFVRWRQAHRELAVVAVTGNHDLQAGPVPESLGVEQAGAVHVQRGLVFRHDPEPDPQGRPVLAGHVHPAVWLHGPGRSAERLSCFLFRERLAILPAFGTFTGMKALRLRRGERVFVVGPGEVVEVSSAATRSI
ncbi:MAG: ligase-associated DNA damage response endonuclease PdeM [Phycisphaeraceae bacterium]